MNNVFLMSMPNFVRVKKLKNFVFFYSIKKISLFFLNTFQPNLINFLVTFSSKFDATSERRHRIKIKNISSEHIINGDQRFSCRIMPHSRTSIMAGHHD